MTDNGEVPKVHFCSSSQPSISPAQRVGWQLLEVYEKQEGTLMFSVAPIETRTGNGDVPAFTDTLLPSLTNSGSLLFAHRNAEHVMI